MGGEAVGNLGLFRQSQGEVETAVMEPLREGRLDAWQDAGDVVEEQGVLHDAFRMGEGGDFQVDVHHAAGEGGEVAVLHHAVAHVQPFTAQVVVAEGAALLVNGDESAVLHGTSSLPVSLPPSRPPASP